MKVVKKVVHHRIVIDNDADIFTFMYQNLIGFGNGFIIDSPNISIHISRQFKVKFAQMGYFLFQS
jgi:hypothetical protein